MREIVFRGKREEDGKWLYGSLLKLWNKHIKDFLYNINGTGAGCTIKPETIGQYTGLKDKNGKMIFEGDVVKIDIFGARLETFEVIWHISALKLKSKNCKTFYDYSIHDDTPITEIIGNIHDNPELFEEQK